MYTNGAFPAVWAGGFTLALTLDRATKSACVANWRDSAASLPNNAARLGIVKFFCSLLFLPSLVYCTGLKREHRPFIFCLL